MPNKALLSSLFIVLILILFLRNVISSFIVFLSVLFSLAGAVVFLYVSGIGLNIMTLSAMALSFGIIVDNSIVIFENIQRHLEERRGNGIDVILAGVNEMKLPVIAASLTTVGALVPVFLLPENLKPYFIQFAIMAGFVIIFSLFVSLTFIPIASSKVLKKAKVYQGSKVLNSIANIYKRVLRWNLKHKWAVVIFTVWLFGLPVWMLPAGYEVKRPEYFFVIGEREKIPLILIAITSVGLVFMITASLYESFKKPFVIILSVPISLIGLFLVFYLFDVNFGRGGYAGLILLIGLSVNNGIILVDKIARSISESGVKYNEPAYDDVIASSALSRVRPILITNLTTIAGFTPFIFTKNIYSLWYSFSVAVSGGLLFSMLIVLFVIPVFYKIIAK